MKTNIVEEVRPVVVFETNEVNQIVTVTNFIPFPIPSIVTVTQEVEAYTLTPKETSKELIQTGAGIGNMVAPGVGTAIGGALLGLLGAWARIRSSKKTGTALAQNIEGIREFILTLPDGDKIDDAITSYLERNQTTVGVVDQVSDMLLKYVSQPQARDAATEIKNALAKLKQHS